MIQLKIQKDMVEMDGYQIRNLFGGIPRNFGVIKIFKIKID